jgi:beta-glucosidase/6-phospho-beta-glucosidase/beta-galactosidase
MRTLELIEEHEGIDQQALDDYAKLFAQPLPDSHLLSLAALFHWSLPEILGEDGGWAVEFSHQMSFLGRFTIL